MRIKHLLLVLAYGFAFFAGRQATNFREVGFFVVGGICMALIGLWKDLYQEGK